MLRRGINSRATLRATSTIFLDVLENQAFARINHGFTGGYASQRNPLQRRKTAKDRVLSPLRLPFRHIGHLPTKTRVSVRSAAAAIVKSPGFYWGGMKCCAEEIGLPLNLKGAK